MGLFGLFKKEERTTKGKAAASLEEVFTHFKALLKENNETLELMADLEEKQSGRFLFDLTYLRDIVSRIAEKTEQVIFHLQQIAPDRYEELTEVHRRIHEQVRKTLERKNRIPQGEFVIPLERINRKGVLQGGGKGAHLAEVKNVLGLPCPEGFVITTSAYASFLAQNELEKAVFELLSRSRQGDSQSLKETEKAVRTLILEAPLPPELHKEILQTAQKLQKKNGGSSGLALRSSSVLEDSHHFSFAGQYATFLNLQPEEIPSKYKEIVAGQFNARSLFYMKSKGILEEETAMAVVCQILIPARASGVLFTSHEDPEKGETVLINALWGLGKWVVEGTVHPDLYLLDKQSGRILLQRPARKTHKLQAKEGGGLMETSVPQPLQEIPCLGPVSLTLLWEWARKLEDHFGHPQDVEWVLGPDDRLYILQTRNLRTHGLRKDRRRPSVSLGEFPVLLEGGTVGSFGIGAGPVFKVKAPGDLEDFPKGAVLVAPNTSSRFVSVMDKAAAIVTDVGSATGHMAVLAREFRLPALVDTGEATRKLENGQMVTVDAYNARIYAGRVESLLEGHPEGDPLFLQTPVYTRLQEVIAHIVPLVLADPKQDTFQPRFCRTFHDLIRYAHEKGIEEMFRLAERMDVQKLSPVRIRTRLPLNLYLLDLGGGIRRTGVLHRSLPPENVLSLPFQALWKGITWPGVRWAGPIGVDVKGLLSVMAQSAVQSPEGFWDRTLALVSENYLNFSSRLGYHFATVDTYCSTVRNDNYITFVFKGGAADGLRRNRRARFLGIVLEELGFEVLVREDLVKADYRKYPQGMTEEKLTHLGRLMGCARQLDMAMSDEGLVHWYARAYLEGNYTFKNMEQSASMRKGISKPDKG